MTITRLCLFISQQKLLLRLEVERKGAHGWTLTQYTPHPHLKPQAAAYLTAVLPVECVLLIFPKFNFCD